MMNDKPIQSANKYDFFNLSENDIYDMAWELLKQRPALPIMAALSLAKSFVETIQFDIRKQQFVETIQDNIRKQQEGATP